MSENKEAIKKIIEILTSTEVYSTELIIESPTGTRKECLTMIMGDNVAEQYAAALVQHGLAMGSDDDKQRSPSIEEFFN